MNRLTIATLIALALPSTASGAPLGELPFTALPGPAACLASTGSGLAIMATYSSRDVTTDLLAVGPGGAQATERVSVGRVHSCPSVAEAPGGAAVIAGGVRRNEEPNNVTIKAALREPGAAFGQAVGLGTGAGAPVVAVAPNGHAVVAWARQTEERLIVVAARRAPGGAFGAPETVASRRLAALGDVDLAAGVDAAGRATLLWSRELPSGAESIEAASAAAGAPFAVERLASHVGYDADPVLAVAPDGWALAAHRRDDGSPRTVYERAPGAASFTVVALSPPRFSDEPAVAIRDGGGALVAWRGGASGDRDDVQVATRVGPGGFGAPVTVATPRLFYPAVALDELFDPTLQLILARPPLDSGSARLSAAIAPDGRALVSWTGAAGRESLVAAAPQSALGRLGGSFEPAQRLGGSLRSAEDVVPLFLADGRAAVAWTDQAQRGLGRLHLAFESAPGPAWPAVRLRLRAPRIQRLFLGQPPRVTAVCDRPCDLRASVGSSIGPGAPRSDTNLAGGAHRLDVGVIEDLRRGPARPVRVVVSAGAPGGRRTVVRRLRLRVALRKAPPLRRPLSVRARRRGGAIIVTWRTAGSARRQTFVVMAGAGTEVDPGAAAVRDGRGRRLFSARLRPQRPDDVPWVLVLSLGRDGGLKSADPVRVQ
jgi:hypothetical protein